jgi:glutathione peroxidase
MTLKQKLLKAVYPGYVWLSKKNEVISNKNVEPPISFYSLKETLINGQPFCFDQLKGKKILLVNTASDCVYTRQYEELEELQQQNQNKLMIIGFPSNEFNEQEKEDDNNIAKFCKVNYGVTFVLMKKSFVKRSADQEKVYDWLTDKNKNGWNSKQPSWNFCKYLIDENGKLTHYFSSSIEPLGKEMREALK